MITVELRRSGGWALAIIAAGLTVLVMRGDMLTDVWLWPQASHGALYSAVLVGPLAAAAGAWWSGRDRRAGLTTLFDSHARPPAARVAGRMVALAAWLGAGQLLGMAVVFVPTTIQATAGAPWWPPILALLLFTHACAAGGFVLGSTRLPSWLAGGLSAAAVYILIGFSSYMTPDSARWARVVAALSPVDFSLWTPGEVLRTRTALLVPVTLIGLAAVLAAGLLIRRQAPRATAIVAVVALAALLSGSLALATDPQGVAAWTDREQFRAYSDALFAGREPADQPPVSCRDERGVQVCIAPAYLALRDQIAAVAAPTLAPIATATGGTVRLTQVLTPYGPLPPWPDGTLPFGLPLGGSATRLDAVPTLAAGTAVGGGCGRDASINGDFSSSDFSPSDDRGSDIESPEFAQRLVAEWLLRRTGQTWTPGARLDFGRRSPSVPTEAERMAQATVAVPTSTWTAWLAAHLDALRRCEITPAQLPIESEPT